MDFLKATNQQIKVIIESDGDCPPHLLYQAVEEAIRRNLFVGLMYTLVTKKMSIEYVEQVLKTTLADIQQAFNIKAFDALKFYKPGKNPFISFWTRFMLIELSEIIKFNNSQKRTGTTVTIDDDEVRPIHIVSDHNVERLVLNRLDIQKRLSVLTPFQREIVLLREKGYTFPEIGEKMGYGRAYMWNSYKSALEQMREGA